MLAGKHVAIVAAMAANRVIGLENDIPWKIPGEQTRFRALTLDRLVVMGRKTFESIGKPLPRRDVLVLSSRPDAVSGRARSNRSTTRSRRFATIAGWTWSSGVDSRFTRCSCPMRISCI